MAIPGSYAAADPALDIRSDHYAAVARLKRRGLIEALEPVDRRRPYRLTGIGAEALKTQLRDLSPFASAGLQRLGEAGR
jgi:DNA-binding PadR family transcriptional regulator